LQEQNEADFDLLLTGCDPKEIDDSRRDLYYRERRGQSEVSFGKRALPSLIEVLREALFKGMSNQKLLYVPTQVRK
jgi:hypothetical protein